MFSRLANTFHRNHTVANTALQIQGGLKDEKKFIFTMTDIRKATKRSETVAWFTFVDVDEID